MTMEGFSKQGASKLAIPQYFPAGYFFRQKEGNGFVLAGSIKIDKQFCIYFLFQYAWIWQKESITNTTSYWRLRFNLLPFKFFCLHQFTATNAHSVLMGKWLVFYNLCHTLWYISENIEVTEYKRFLEIAQETDWLIFIVLCAFCHSVFWNSILAQYI